MMDSIFFWPSGVPAKRGGASTPQIRSRVSGGELRRRNSFPPSNEIKRGPRAAKAAWDGKKKMRSLGTVQMPTEAFMAVLKLDEE